MAKVNLIIEKGDDGKFWGRVNYRNNLIVEVASSIEILDRKMRKIIKDFHDREVELEHSYDVVSFFENFDFLNQSRIAELSGIGSSLLKQYGSGERYPSEQQVKKIESAIHKLAKELKSISLFAWNGKSNKSWKKF